MEELMNNRSFGAFLMLLAGIVGAIGIYIFNSSNNLIAEERHVEVTSGIDNVGLQSSENKNEILEKVVKTKEKAIENKDEIITKIESARDNIKEEVRQQAQSQERINVESESELPLVIGNILKGHKNLDDPTNFDVSSERGTDGAIKRKESWPQFKQDYDLAWLDIPFEITNYNEFPIVEVRIKITWIKPTYSFGYTTRKGSNKYSNHRAFYYVTNEDLEESKEPFNFVMTRIKFEEIRISSLKPNESLEISMLRATQKYFHQKPNIEISFIDLEGQEWKKINNNKVEKVM